jgi:ribosomal RNA adenine dimethylase
VEGSSGFRGARGLSGPLGSSPKTPKKGRIRGHGRYETIFLGVARNGFQVVSAEREAPRVRRPVGLPSLNELNLGGHVLELGPGPGVTTDLLRQRTARLTAVEIDPRLAASL